MLIQASHEVVLNASFLAVTGLSLSCFVASKLLLTDISTQ